jgi:hypothetical protein
MTSALRLRADLLGLAPSFAVGEAFAVRSDDAFGGLDGAVAFHTEVQVAD